ncbi:class I SAM-dependent methyltransferase [Acinetobacter sp. Ac_5812]|uniref:class I SAM-dependent methyltransferase n=1 Tax=Acinetobacter sp. Ac_5812 TaxID=1848937 RepID=UPI00148FC5A7|nr:class I SAM-dependent methyltransferase [Acinetobacter sp. Ac_5812]NNP69108.1 SAM-dependent methyltransferase [Acinetobacter sp. Ac_5812]
MAKDFNSQKVVERYDDHIRRLIPGYALMHQQVDAILQSALSADAQILIVGCGTGYELEYLLNRHPTWRFTAVDPSLSMLQKAQALIQQLGQSERVQFIHGETAALPTQPKFDAALSILVAHFVPHALKSDFFAEISKRLRAKGLLITYDLMAVEDPLQFQALPLLCQSNGLSVEQSQAMMERLGQDFFTLAFDDYQQLLQRTGFAQVHCFSQVLIYQGLIAQKKQDDILTSEHSGKVVFAQ